jgi:hypothetical protein
MVDPHPLASVVVIGGGVAGMTAAIELAKSGCRVTLVEADSRLGGRVRTVDNPDIAPWPIALGAEFVHGSGSVLHDLAQEYGWTFSEELFNLESNAAVGGGTGSCRRTLLVGRVAEAAAAASTTTTTTKEEGHKPPPPPPPPSSSSLRRTHVENAVELKQLQYSVCIFVDGALVPYSMGGSGGGGGIDGAHLEFLERHFRSSAGPPHNGSSAAAAAAAADPRDRTLQYARQFWETHVLPLAQRVYESQGRQL